MKNRGEKRCKEGKWGLKGLKAKILSGPRGLTLFQMVSTFYSPRINPLRHVLQT